MARPYILVTNDDGIESPGLAAAAAALDPLGELLIVAPLTQQTSMGRARSQQGRDGRLSRHTVNHGEQSWPGFGVNATPAVTVEHALQRLAQRPPDLVVSGVNYGENTGTCVTVSGTIGAALEAAEHGIPSMAVSLETAVSEYYEHRQADWRAAVHYVRFFAAHMLSRRLPPDVDVLKIEIPAAATPESEWTVTRQDKIVYYRPTLPGSLDNPDGEVHFVYRVAKGEYSGMGTDAHALAQGLISVTPLSLDLTSRVSLDDVRRLFD
jgi:5'-nucleotidase